MAAFAQFASDLDPSTQKLLARGARLTELLKQPQFAPLSTEEEVVSIFAGVRGYLDKLEVRDVGRFEKGLLAEIKVKAPEILSIIATEKSISGDTEAKLKAFLDAYAKTFA
jgi:F-type H+-transporting ATPase subunit alpha